MARLSGRAFTGDVSAATRILTGRPDSLPFRDQALCFFFSDFSDTGASPDAASSR